MLRRSDSAVAISAGEPESVSSNSGMTTRRMMRIAASHSCYVYLDCHSERSEESRFLPAPAELLLPAKTLIPHFARNDNSGGAGRTRAPVLHFVTATLRPTLLLTIACYTGQYSNRLWRPVRRVCLFPRFFHCAGRRCGRRCVRWRPGEK